MSTNHDIPDHLIDQLVDTDPAETAEWTQSLDAVLKSAGPVRARYLMLSMLKRARIKRWPFALGNHNQANQGSD